MSMNILANSPLAFPFNLHHYQKTRANWQKAATAMAGDQVTFSGDRPHKTTQQKVIDTFKGRL